MAVDSFSPCFNRCGNHAMIEIGVRVCVKGVHKLSSDFNPHRIAQNLIELMKNEKFAAKISENGFQYVKKFHNIRKWSQEWRSLVSEVVHET